MEEDLDYAARRDPHIYTSKLVWFISLTLFFLLYHILGELQVLDGVFKIVVRLCRNLHDSAYCGSKNRRSSTTSTEAVCSVTVTHGKLPTIRELPLSHVTSEVKHPCCATLVHDRRPPQRYAQTLNTLLNAVSFTQYPQIDDRMLIMA
jgi:hypothetical protein